VKKLHWAIGCIGALTCATAGAGVGVWSGQGPDGGYINDVLNDASAPLTLYVSTRSGIFKSADGGSTWAPSMDGIVGSVGYGYPLVRDADAANTLYAVDSTGHLYRTTNGAATWVQTGYALPPITPSLSQINRVADGPASTTRIYLATYASGVLASNDSGATFTAINGSGGSTLPTGVSLQTVVVDPANPNNLLAGTAFNDAGPGPNAASVYHSTDGGLHWSGVITLAVANYLYNPADPSCAGPTPPPNICTIATERYFATVGDISFGNGSEVYANVDSVIYRSPDSGATWNPIPATPNYTTTVKADTSAANTLLAGGFFGLKRSSNGGASFSDVATAANGFTPNGVDVATVSHVAFSGSTLWIASQEAGMFRSVDGGAHWASDNTGLNATNLRALGMVPVSGSPPRILAGYGDAFRPSPGIYAGSDAGDGSVSWSNSNTGLRAYQIRAITVDPTTATGTPGTTVVYAGGRSEQAVAIAPRNGGVYKSSDGGSTWTTIDNGLPLRLPAPATPYVGTVRSIVLDPHSCTGFPTCTSALHTVYATSNGCKVSGGNCTGSGTYQFRIFKSTNGGGSWVNSDSGIPQSLDGTVANNYNDFESMLVVPLVIDPVNPNILYAGTSDTFDPNYVLHPTLLSGIFKSTDSGASWNPVNTGLPTYPSPSTTVLSVLTLAINPTTPTTLWASVIDVNAGGGAPGHVYKSVDGGAHWTDSSTGLTSADIRALYVDPTSPNILFAAGGGTFGNPGGVFKSYDGGATWHSISIGLPADAALALALDPGDHNKLYAGASSGVWEITQTLDTDLDGVSDIQENMGPNGGDSNLDGTPDRMQSDVTYVPPHLSARAPAGTNTSSNDFAVQVTPQAGATCAQTQDVQSKSASANGPDPIAANLDYRYDVDLLQFEILNCATTTVKVTYPNASFGAGWSFRFYGPATPGDDASVKWCDFTPNAVKLDAHSWILTLTRGAFGSYRPASTGSILFQGGPAFSDRVFGNGFD
jgi:photosystem II stability/assembly factor-like uncharacterized protein